MRPRPRETLPVCRAAMREQACSARNDGGMSYDFGGGLSDKRAIDELTATFFRAFDNRHAPPEVDVLYRLFAPGAIVVKNVGGTPEVYDVRGFVEPRRAILTDGSIDDFSEEEVSERTDIFGNIAQRFSRYKKSGTAHGERFEGGGAKSIQFVRGPEGWRIASLVWDDE